MLEIEVARKPSPMPPQKHSIGGCTGFTNQQVGLPALRFLLVFYSITAAGKCAVFEVRNMEQTDRQTCRRIANLQHC